jgi:hypothetical protein
VAGQARKVEVPHDQLPVGRRDQVPSRGLPRGVARERRRRQYSTAHCRAIRFGGGGAAARQKMPRCAFREGQVRWAASARCDEATPLEIVEGLLDACPVALQSKDDDGDLPLHLATRYAPLETIRLLIERRTDSLMDKNKCGMRPPELARYAEDTADDIFAQRNAAAAAQSRLLQRDSASEMQQVQQQEVQQPEVQKQEVQQQQQAQKQQAQKKHVRKQQAQKQHVQKQQAQKQHVQQQEILQQEVQQQQAQKQVQQQEVQQLEVKQQQEQVDQDALRSH